MYLNSMGLDSAAFLSPSQYTATQEEHARVYNIVLESVRMVQQFPRSVTLPSEGVRLRAWNSVSNVPIKKGYYAIQSLDNRYNYEATAMTRQLKVDELDNTTMPGTSTFTDWVPTFERVLGELERLGENLSNESRITKLQRAATQYWSQKISVIAGRRRIAHITLEVPLKP